MNNQPIALADQGSEFIAFIKSLPSVANYHTSCNGSNALGSAGNRTTKLKKVIHSLSPSEDLAELVKILYVLGENTIKTYCIEISETEKKEQLNDIIWHIAQGEWIATWAYDSVKLFLPELIPVTALGAQRLSQRKCEVDQFLSDHFL